jgi:hypothetical protein
MLRWSSEFSDVLVVIACFSFFMAIAFSVGAFCPAVLVGHYVFTGNVDDWRNFLIVLTNGVLAGACLGFVYGCFCVLRCAMFRVAGDRGTLSDRGLDMLQTPLFIFGTVGGALVGTLTATRFHQTWIWIWWTGIL